MKYQDSTDVFLYNPLLHSPVLSAPSSSLSAQLCLVALLKTTVGFNSANSFLILSGTTASAVETIKFPKEGKEFSCEAVEGIESSTEHECSRSRMTC